MRRRRHHHPDPNRNDAYERYSAWRALEPATTVAPSAAPVVQQRTLLSSCEQSRRVDDSSCVRRSVAGGIVLLTSTNGWLVVDSGPWEVPLDRSVWLACRCSYSATTAAASSVFRTLGHSELSDCFWPNHDIQLRDRRGYSCVIFGRKPPLQPMGTVGNQSSGTAPITVSTIWRLRRSSASRKALREPNLPHATAEGPR